jgi:hypothetical protein
MGLETILPEGMVITTTLEKLVDWGRGRSPFPFLFGLACCAIEMMAAGGPRHDVARFGAEVFRGTPRQSDVMIVSGRISQKMAPVVKRLYADARAQMGHRHGSLCLMWRPFRKLCHHPGCRQADPGGRVHPGLSTPPRGTTLWYHAIVRKDPDGEVQQL